MISGLKNQLLQSYWGFSLYKPPVTSQTLELVVAVHCWKTALDDIKSNMKLTDMVRDPNSIGSKSLFYKKKFLHRIQVEFWWAYDVSWFINCLHHKHCVMLIFCFVVMCMWQYKMYETSLTKKAHSIWKKKGNCVHCFLFRLSIQVFGFHSFGWIAPINHNSFCILGLSCTQ